MKINFRCKICNSIQEIEEVLENVTQYSTLCSDIEKYSDGGVAIDSELTNSEYGELSHYQCMNCGETLKNHGMTITTPEELYEWLEENNMLEEN